MFDVAEQIRDVERLKGLYDVFAETLHQLSKLGIAGQENHGVYNLVNLQRNAGRDSSF